jgi:hypothetical protein
MQYLSKVIALPSSRSRLGKHPINDHPFTTWHKIPIWPNTASSNDDFFNHLESEVGIHITSMLIRRFQPRWKTGFLCLFKKGLKEAADHT